MKLKVQNNIPEIFISIECIHKLKRCLHNNSKKLRLHLSKKKKKKKSIVMLQELEALKFLQPRHS